MGVIERLRVGDAVKAHGWTALFAAVTVVMTRIETTDFALDAMHGRTMGWATAQGFDVSVRTGLVWSSLVLALVVFAGVALGLARLGRLLGERAVDLCEPLALAGLAFWLARAFTLPMWSSINLVMALCAANLAIAALDRFVFRVEGPTARGAWLASLAIAGLGIVTLHDDFRAWNAPSAARAMDWIVGLAPLLLHALARLATWRRDPARRAAAFALLFPALPWLAWLPFASVMREELYLGLGRGDAGPSLNTLEACVLAVLAACAVASSWKARRAGSLPDLAPLVERRSLPWVIAAATALAFYRPWSPLHPDLMEPANPGLLVQQYFDFGRVPFVETFGAHGLSDSFSGFLYRAVNGMREEQWIYWEFLDPVVLAVVLYAALRAATRNAWLALFAVAFFPFLCEVAPTYCGLALAAPFVARAAARRGSALAWFGWALFHAFLFLWRLDLGFASLIASAGALAALAWLDPSSRPRWSPLLRGLGGATLLGLAAWFLVCAARGGDGVARLVDLAHVGGSSQGVRAPILARTYTPLFHVHHFVVPAGVLVLLVVLLAREKGRVAEGTPRRALAFTLVFACIYYFANMQRGLVRHTFLEMGNVFLGSFAFLAFALAWWIADGLTERARAACFVGTATLLAGA
ncbi:MAG: hypothetical protein HZA53_10010, partial [Planctomycetes bacterium]|nr:hypothetical protein [Planctomycetota bacterium]